MDICPNCEFSAIHPYTPSVDAVELLRSGFSPLDVCEASVLNDIANLKQELQQIESLFIQIRDRRNKVVKDLGSCKALLAPIRRLPRETLLHIFSLASSNSPDPLDAPWSIGQVCFTWRNISRSCPSLWTRIDVSESYRDCPIFLEEYTALSRDLPIRLCVIDDIDDETMAALSIFALRSERWSSLELDMSGGGLSELLSLAALPAIQLTKLSIGVFGEFQPLKNLFSSSPIREAHLQRIAYSQMPINVTELRKFHVYAYDPAELHSILQHAQHLLDFSITPAPPPPTFASNIPIPYPHLHHTSLQRLSFVVTLEITRGVTKIPVTFNYVSLPALQQFDILVREEEPLFGILPGNFEPVDYSRLLDLFRRSECNLTILTFAVPVAVEALLIPILMQSPALKKLDICVNASVARDVFKALNLEQGGAECLRELLVRETPIIMEPNSGILGEADAFHAMVLSRSDGDHLEKVGIVLNVILDRRRLPIPVSKESPFRDLVRLKNEGLNVEFFLNGEDCLVDGEAHIHFFGSA